MRSTLRKVLHALSERLDEFLIALYAHSVYEYARQRKLLPLTAPTLARFVLVDRSSDEVRSLLAAYSVKADPATLNAAAADHSSVEGKISSAVFEIIAGAYYYARLSRGSRRVQAPYLLVSLARHEASAAMMDRLRLTPLRVTYFLSHGRVLPATRDDELAKLPALAGEVFVRVGNDDYTPMELVMKILTEVFDLDAQRAQETMLTVHRHRESLLGPYPYEDARARATTAITMARDAEAPLLVSLVKG